jgi:hypothetical protein
VTTANPEETEDKRTSRSTKLYIKKSAVLIFFSSLVKGSSRKLGTSTATPCLALNKSIHSSLPPDLLDSELTTTKKGFCSLPTADPESKA